MNKFFSFLLLACSILFAEAYPRAQWIHYPEPDEKGLNQNRFFWTDIEVPQEADGIEIVFHLDDGGNLLIDGENISASALKGTGGNFKKPASLYDDFSRFAPGTPHRIEFRDVNGGAKGGILCRISFFSQGEVIQEVLSDASWLTAKNPSRQGGEAEALASEVHCDLLGLPFGAYFDPYPLYCKEERKSIDALKAEKEARYQKFLQDVLDKEDPANASVVYDNGLPMIAINEKIFPPIIYSVHHYQNFEYDKYVQSAINFRDAGLHLYVMGIPLGTVWSGPGQYNLQSIDDWMEDALLLDPEAYIMFEIAGRTLPTWWVKEHPEECVEYLNDVQPVTTTEQLNSRYVAPSFASELYLNDLNQFMKALGEYIDSKPWGKRIFAFRNDNGIYLEWHHWGMSFSMPDVSKPMQRHFKKFLRERYGSDEALQAAWNDPTVTIDTATLATKEERLTPHAGDLMNPVKDIRAVDSVRCVLNAIADFQQSTNHTLKETCNRRCLVGNFYGYFFGMGYPAVGWHLELERILNSPDTDFNCQPPPYSPLARSFGQAQFSRGLVSSYRLHGKLNLIEADTRTCDVPIGTNHSYTTTPAESVQLLARDFCQALCCGVGFWYFDFGEGWYTWPEIRDYLAKLRPIWDDKSVDNSSAAEVLLIGDMESVFYQSNDNSHNTIRSFIDNNRMELSHTGVPFDTILLSDLESPNLRQDYKVYIFINTLLCTPERIAIAERLRAQGKTIVWLDKAGYLNADNGASTETTQELTGFQVTCKNSDFIPELRCGDGISRRGTFHTPDSAKPLMVIQDPDAELLGTSSDFPTFSRKKNPAGGWSYLATVPFLKSRDYLGIFHDAGVHVYCEDEDVAVYANKSHLMIHTEFAGEHLLSLPRPCKLIQLLPTECVLAEKAREFQLKTEAKTTYLLRME